MSGSQQALDLCARVLVDAGDAVVVEEPGYPGARQLFAAAGRRAAARSPVDADGLVGSAHPGRGAAGVRHPVTPVPARRVAVARTPARAARVGARARGAFVIEDDYDSEFRYGGRAAARAAGPR